MKNVRLTFPCLWVPKTPGGGTRLEIGAFYHRLARGSENGSAVDCSQQIRLSERRVVHPAHRGREPS
jgi:hypothetical protein